MHPDFEAVIGLEVHCQLATSTKIFCGCPARTQPGKSVADTEANSHVCPVCAGHPGTLPVLNRKVVEFAIQAGLATNCRINTGNVFARKNYFYPDLPKGYQISQFENPICTNGWICVETNSGIRKIAIHRIHMEEDAGKNVHRAGYSLVNLNRAGVPLIEIVTGPDMRTSEEAGAYLRALYSIVTYLGICDGNLEEGNFRCDVNISVMPKTSSVLGTRAEIKNVNSFRFVEKAIEYEISRQVEILRAGGKVVQETRTFDSAKNITISMRSKEEAQDYRYFPDPDLIPIRIDSQWIDRLRQSLPELPEAIRSRLVEEWGLTSYDAGVLTASKSLVSFFKETVTHLVNAGCESKVAGKATANWITGEMTRLLNEDGIEIEKSNLKPSHLSDLVKMVLDQAISVTAAKQVIAVVWKTGTKVSQVVDQLGLRQVSDLSALEPILDKVIASFPKQVGEFRSGKEKLLGFLVGQVMKETGGKANPVILGDLLKKRLTGNN